MIRSSMRRAGVASLALLLAACAGTRPPASPHGAMPPSAPAAPAITEAHYRVYTSDGRPATFDDIVAAMAERDVVFVGETHDDPVGHYLEARLLEAAHARYGNARPVALSLEMFDRDVQHIVDEYVDSLITERHFLASSNPWNNYATDYRPMVEYARTHGLRVLAANTPRRYVNRVSRLGPASLGALGDRARTALPPLPYPEPSMAYREKWQRAMGGATGQHGSAPTADSSGMPPVTNLLYAQALWDAGMGHAVAEYLNAHPGALVVHVVGGFHVESGSGTPEALVHYRPGTRTLNVALRPAADVTTFSGDFTGHGDFIIETDASLPRSFQQQP